MILKKRIRAGREISAQQLLQLVRIIKEFDGNSALLEALTPFFPIRCRGNVHLFSNSGTSWISEVKLEGEKCSFACRVIGIKDQADVIVEYYGCYEEAFKEFAEAVIYSVEKELNKEEKKSRLLPNLKKLR